jgi:hypothetical protein
MLVESGVIVHKTDGSMEADSPEEGKRRLEAMDSETRALYEKD